MVSLVLVLVREGDRDGRGRTKRPPKNPPSLEDPRSSSSRPIEVSGTDSSPSPSSSDLDSRIGRPCESTGSAGDDEMAFWYLWCVKRTIPANSSTEEFIASALGAIRVHGQGWKRTDHGHEQTGKVDGRQLVPERPRGNRDRRHLLKDSSYTQRDDSGALDDAVERSKGSTGVKTPFKRQKEGR